MRKFAVYGITTLAVAGMAGFGTYSVSAMQGPNAQNGGTATAARNGQQSGNGAQQSLENRATAVGMTAEQLRTELQTKTMQEVLTEKGMTLEQYQAKMRTTSQANWTARGLSDAEKATRQAQQAERQADCDGTGTGNGSGQGYGNRNAAS